jgi:predicted XRE-type DNA-binding protein/phage-related protein
MPRTIDSKKTVRLELASLRPIIWAPQTLPELRSFPKKVKREFGRALQFAQAGDKHPAAKPLRGFGGGGILEIVEDYDRRSYRAVLYGSLQGSRVRSPCVPEEIEEGNRNDAVSREPDQGEIEVGDPKSRAEKWVKSSGNVFADLGFANADELSVETELLRRIIAIVRERNLSQRAAARVLGIDQPKVCALMNGRTRGYSIARMLRFLAALDQDVEIRIRPKPRSRSRALVRVAA